MNGPIIAAYYYPGWYRCADRRVRGGDSEWNLLYDAVSRHEHLDVRRPLAGPVDTTVESLEAEARLAMCSGIDAFLWCWYWDHGRLLLNESLDMFRRCDLPTGFRYALMWVNKRPHFTLPLDGESLRGEADRFIQTDEDDFRGMIAHLIERHWSRDTYIKIARRPLLPMFSVEPLFKQLGARRLAGLLASGNAMARAAGFDGVHYVAITHGPGRAQRWLDRLGLSTNWQSMPLRGVGYRSVSNYVHLPDWRGPRRQSYRDLVDLRAAEWPATRRQFGLPYWPSVSPGWDARSRGAPLADPPQTHPWAPVITDETPRDFARLLAHWKSFAAQAGDVPVLPIASWNEWTEGHAIAPCDRHGDGMLRVVSQFKNSLHAEMLPHLASASLERAALGKMEQRRLPA